jgi:predicted phage tail protein
MCRHVSDNERLEHRLEELEKNVDVSEAVQDFVDEKMQEQLELLEEKVAELEEKLEKTLDFRHIPQKNRLKLIADQREEQQESVSEVGEMISVEE